MNKQFNLSEKRTALVNAKGELVFCYKENDLKELIKILKIKSTRSKYSVSMNLIKKHFGENFK